MTVRTGRLHRTAAIALGAAGVLLTAGCTGDPKPAPTSTFRDTVGPDGEFRLVAFSSCQDALDKLKQAAKEYVGPYGFGGRDMASAAEGAAAPDRRAMAAAPNAAGAGTAADTAAPAYSGTNTHEAGVDEPDLVKTDGRRIVTVSRGVLQVVDPATRQVTGSLDLTPSNQDNYGWGDTDLLLSGDRALVMQPGYGMRAGGVTDTPGKPVDPKAISGPKLLLVDLSGAPRLLSSYTVDGGLVDARQVGTTARVVVRSAPRVEFPYEGRGSDKQRLARNKAIIDRATADDWLPRYSVTSGGRTTIGRVDCGAVNRPAQYSGTSMVTVLSFDLGAATLGTGDPVTVVADGDTVYSNGPSLYVANDQRWRAIPLVEPGPPGAPRRPDEATEIYRFDTSGSGKPRYVAAGSVPGWLINQYALSEWDGHLRVATTSNANDQSTVYVLRQDGKVLRQTGKVGGLGKGERIYAVRFVGPTGYVVTFRQTDPLYTVDLSDPARPEVAGELKIPGYSAYLHPAGDGRLIGVGQEATEQGRVQGTQVSLFDVSDLGKPTRLAQYHIPQTQSEAEHDPHAFLYWPADRLLVVPLVAYNTGKAGSVLVLKVGDDSLTEVGTVAPQSGTQIRRSLVVDGTLWTLSDSALQASSMSTLDRIASVPLN